MSYAVRLAGIAFVFVFVAGCSGSSSASDLSDSSTAPSDSPQAATASASPKKIAVDGDRVAFNDASFLETYEATRDLQGDDAATAFAEGAVKNRAGVELEDKQSVTLLARQDSRNTNRYGQNCNVRVLDTVNTWVQCSWLSDLSTPMPYGKSGTFDAEGADAKGNALAYLFPTLGEACAYETARAANKTPQIPQDATVLQGLDHLKARMIHSRSGYDCSDSFAIDANYVEVLEGPGKGSKGWTGAYADDQTTP